MTEPVALRVKNKGGMDWQLLPFTPRGHYDFIEPLYTAEQLHPRVKMTQEEFDELNTILEYAGVYGAMNKVYSDNNTLMLLKKRFGGSNGQVELANLWFEYRSNNRTQQKTIEIVHDMKWFVQKKDFNGDYRFLKINAKDLSFNHKKDKAACFDTKEEAEKWTNPLTEAVQLPVEGE